MGFTAYRATRDFNLGQIRHTVHAGDVLDFDGRMTRVAGKEHRISTLDVIINDGWLVPVAPEGQPPALPAIRAPNLPAKSTTDPLAVAEAIKDDIDVTGLASMGVIVERGASRAEVEARLPYVHQEARDAAGKRPAPNQKHVWDSDWLNNAPGTRTCKVCGVTERGDLIRADIRFGNGKQLHHYTDVLGRTVSTMKEMSCPTFLGVDAASGAIEAKEAAREARWAIEAVVPGMAALEDRLARLEAENEALRAALLEKPVVDATAVAAELLRLVEERAAATRALAQPEVRMLPAPSLDAEVLDLVEPEKVPVEVPTSESEPSSP